MDGSSGRSDVVDEGKMKLLKTAAGLVGFLGALPHRVGFFLIRRLLSRDRAFAASSERIARVPAMCGLYIRKSFYRAALAQVGRDVPFGFMSLFSKTNIRVGDRVYIGRFCTIGWVDLGDDVMLADGVQLLSGRHQHLSTDGLRPDRDALRLTRITIGRGAWIGAGAVIMADVGEDAIVGAGAVVTRPVQAGVKVAGCPARPVSAVSADGSPTDSGPFGRGGPVTISALHMLSA